MLFNSLDFFIFLAIVLPLYFLLPLRLRQLLLVIASFYFYMYWNVKYSAILVFFIFVDFFAGRYIGMAQTQRRKKIGLLVSLACNLGVLALFKYYGFFVSNLHALGLIKSSPSLGLLLPLGISFHTFQTMSYTIDVYRGVIQPETDLLRFAAFVSCFPQLVAGPIARGRDFLPQIRELQPLLWTNFVSGGQQMLNGFVKKVVLADNLAPWVNQVYARPSAFSGAAVLVATYMFAWQIFFDFSGYSDIAIGVARIMGFHFNTNFNAPYISRTIQEFWRRWHMSLSSWLRDYLYISLGGNRRGPVRTYVNLLLTMLLGGLWHGASWNFVIWGGLHGAWLSVERLLTTMKIGVVDIPFLPKVWSAVRSAVQGTLVFHGVCLAWVFFRAQTLRDSVAAISRMMTWAPGDSFFHDFAFYKCLLVILVGIAYFVMISPASERMPRLRWASSVAAILLVVLFGAESREFIYFVF